MAMDIRFHGACPDPERLSPRRLSHMHGLTMAAVRRDVAMRAQATRRACNAAFNGDKEGVFADYINNMMARPVVRMLNAPEPVENIESSDEADERALEHARRIFNRGNEN